MPFTKSGYMYVAFLPATSKNHRSPEGYVCLFFAISLALPPADLGSCKTARRLALAAALQAGGGMTGCPFSKMLIVSWGELGRAPITRLRPY